MSRQFLKNEAGILMCAAPKLRPAVFLAAETIQLDLALCAQPARVRHPQSANLALGICLQAAGETIPESLLAKAREIWRCHVCPD